jgi:hypothetical protein
MTGTKIGKPFSPVQCAALKKKLRSLRWQPDAVMREVILIQKLRKLVAGL